jgi:hypothetical protein
MGNDVCKWKIFVVWVLQHRNTPETLTRQAILCAIVTPTAFNPRRLCQLQFVVDCGRMNLCDPQVQGRNTSAACRLHQGHDLWYDPDGKVRALVCTRGSKIEIGWPAVKSRHNLDTCCWQRRLGWDTCWVFRVGGDEICNGKVFSCRHEAPR